MTRESVKVIIRDLDLNPRCKHGPTILFSSADDKSFFSCAGVRTTDCFYLDFNDFRQDKVDEYSHKTENDVQSESLSFRKVQTMPSDRRIYCTTCGIFTQSINSHKNHDIVNGISNDFLNEPSIFLQQLNNDKINAQYFFDQKSLEFFCSTFESLKLNKIICLGAPRLHEYIKSNKPGFQSILMDIDDRFQAFNDSNEFIRYNMFNNHFFNGKSDKVKLINFLKSESKTPKHCLFTDPPFGARTELLTITIQTIKSLYNRVNSYPAVLPVFWIFPYFNENHIKQQMSEMEMLDYQVNYMNHPAFSENYKGRKEGSPIRIFTNINPTAVKYSKQLTNYRFCKFCKRFVHTSNQHCRICEKCPSKSGATYRHCPDCILCVKPNYNHCHTCNRCVQKTNHNCKEYQLHQECWLCLKRGHVEKYCEFTKKYKIVKKGICIICKDKKKHNLKFCPMKFKTFLLK